MASVPDSGHTSTQLPQPTQSEALMTGGASPFFRCRWQSALGHMRNDHIARAAPQFAQNGVPLAICWLHRGHCTVSCRDEGRAGCALFCRSFLHGGELFQVAANKKKVSPAAMRNAMSVSIALQITQ